MRGRHGQGQSYVYLQQREGGREGRLWRWFTSPFVEQGIFGVLIGCLVFGGMGSQFERMYGTLGFGFMFMVINVASNILFTFAALFLAPIMPEMHLLSPLNCANGLWVSVLAFLVIYTQRSQQPFMSFWGLCNIPTKFYPWFLLILFALLGASILENLCGILVGYAFHFGYLDRVMPSEQKFSAWETSRHLTLITGSPGYLTWTGSLFSYPADGGGGGGLGNWMSSSTGQSQSATGNVMSGGVIRQGNQDQNRTVPSNVLLPYKSSATIYNAVHWLVCERDKQR
eukprot:756824-Hanusia_phi.AAC.3